MGTEEAARTTTGSGALDGGCAGPMVPRLALGARLRALREERGIGRADAGHVIRASSSSCATSPICSPSTASRTRPSAPP